MTHYFSNNVTHALSKNVTYDLLEQRDAWFLEQRDPWFLEQHDIWLCKRTLVVDELNESRLQSWSGTNTIRGFVIVSSDVIKALTRGHSGWYQVWKLTLRQTSHLWTRGRVSAIQLRADKARGRGGGVGNASTLEVDIQYLKEKTLEREL